MIETFGKLKCKLGRHKEDIELETKIANIHPIKKFIIHVDGEPKFYKVLEADIMEIPYTVCIRCGKKTRMTGTRDMITKGTQREEITEEEFNKLEV